VRRSAARAALVASIAAGLMVAGTGCAPEEPAPDPGGPLARATTLADQGRLAEAWSVMDGELGKRPGSVDELVLFADLCQRLGRVRRGVRTVDTLEERAPDDARVHAVSARLDRDRHWPADALASAERATELAPDEPDYHRLLGELRMEVHDPAGAARAFEEASRLSPDDTVLLGAWGRALVTAGDHEAGLPLLDRYVERNPGDALAHTERGLARVRARDLEGAENDFREAIRLEPSLPTPYHNLALILQRTGRPEEAAEMRERHRH